ncbi:MAG: dihydrodipicolinate synthase family protein [Thermomicrobiales bacterium]
MTTVINRIEGIIPILSMPFLDDDAIDVDSLVAEAEFLVETGVDGVGFGYGSEIVRLTDAERDAALVAVAGAIGGRVPIVAATGANSTRAALLRAEAARAAGADMLMITPPALPAVTPDDLCIHYATIAEQVRLPIIVQDAPGMTGVAMPATLLGRLAEIERVVAVKVEAMPPAPKVSAVVACVGDAAGVLGGAGGVDFVHELERGACGTIPGAALPEFFIAVWRHAQAGQLAEARSTFNRFLPLLTLSARTADTFLFTQKEILRRRGILPSARLRAPCEPLDPAFLREVEALLGELGLAALGRSWQP